MIPGQILKKLNSKEIMDELMAGTCLWEVVKYVGGGGELDGKRVPHVVELMPYFMDGAAGFKKKSIGGKS